MPLDLQARFLAALPSLLLAVATAACSIVVPGSPGQSARPASPATVAAYQGPDRQTLLEEGARREARLTWYTSLAGDSVTGLAEAFERRYPYVDVGVFRAANSELLVRLDEERQARKPAADVVEMNRSALMLLRDEGALTPYASPEAATYPSTAREEAPGGLLYWVTDRESYVGFAYNTRLVRDDDAARTYRDLLKPELRGKMAIAGTDTGTRFLGNVLSHQGDEFGEGLAKQDVAVQMISGQALLELVVTGEVPASPSTFKNHADLAIAKGAPIKWVPLEPVTVNSGSTAVAADAPHPHAAMLFTDFILGTEGRALLEKYQYGSPAADPGFRRWDPELGLTASEYEEQAERWGQFLSSRLIRR
jgi:iron(III) transport system substrate-binding protein